MNYRLYISHSEKTRQPPSVAAAAAAAAGAEQFFFPRRPIDSQCLDYSRYEQLGRRKVT